MSKDNKNTAQKQSPMMKVAAFIVDKRMLFFLLYVIALIFSLFSSRWVSVENDLAEYLSEEQASRRDAVAVEVYGALITIEELSHGEAAQDPFDFLLDLKASPLIDY